MLTQNIILRWKYEKKVFDVPLYEKNCHFYNYKDNKNW